MSFELDPLVGAEDLSVTPWRSQMVSHADGVNSSQNMTMYGNPPSQKMEKVQLTTILVGC